ncbi:MAG: GDP-mannose 4,6-dehydratase [Gemmatimonadota bacterium]
MRTVVITGGAGFIGANLARRCLEAGDRVIVYDTLGRKGGIENLAWLGEHPRSGNLEILVGDVRLPTRELEREIHAAQVVFHMAGQVAVTTSVTDPVTDFEVNALGTFKLLELVRRSEGNRPFFVYASTNKVYGGMEDVAIREDDDRYAYRDFPDGIGEDRLMDFHSPYGCSKGAADQYVRDYARIYGLSTVVFRQSCIYGYRQFGIEDQGWVAWFTIAATLGRPITIYGDGKQVRDVLFIDDLIDAYESAFQRRDEVSGRVYNIGGGPTNAISLRNLVDFLKTEVAPDLSISHGDWRPGDQPVYVSDIRKAREELDWTPKVAWEEGARRLADWVRESRPMFETMF